MNFEKFVSDEKSEPKKSVLEERIKKDEKAQKRITKVIGILEELSNSDKAFAISYGAVNKAVNVKGVFPHTVMSLLAKYGLSVKAQAHVVNKDGEISKNAPEEVRAAFKKRFGKKAKDIITDEKVFNITI